MWQKNRKERLGKCQKISSNLNTSPLCAVRKVTRFNFYCGVRCLGSTQCCSFKQWEFSSVQLPLDTDRWLLPQWQQETCFLVDISRQTRSRLQNARLHRQGWSQATRELTLLLLFSNSLKEIYKYSSYRPVYENYVYLRFQIFSRLSHRS